MTRLPGRSFRRDPGRWHLILAVCIAAIGAVPGQTPITIGPGDTVRLSMPAGSPEATVVTRDLRIAEDGVVTIEARSLDFEPLLQVFLVDPGGGVKLVGGARQDPLRAASLLRLEAGSGARYRIEVRPAFEDWGGEIELSALSGEEEPLAHGAGPGSLDAYWDGVAARARASGNELLAARAALGRLHPLPLQPQIRFLELLPPLEDTLYFGLQAASGWWQPRQRRMRVRSWLLADLEDERPEYERALGVYERLLGDAHPAVGDALLRRGAALLDARSLLEARDLLVRANEITAASLGPDHPQTALTEILLGRLFRQMGDHRRASSLFEHALAVSERSFGTDSVAASCILEDVAVLRWQMEDHGDATDLMERAFLQGKRQLGPEHPRVVRLFRELVMLAAWSLSGDPSPVDREALGREALPDPRVWPAGESLLALVQEHPAVLDAVQESAFDAGLFGTLWSKWFANLIFYVEREQSLMRLRFRLEMLLRECKKNPAMMMECGDQLLLWNDRGEARGLYSASIHSLIAGETLPTAHARLQTDDPRIAESLREGALLTLGSTPSSRAFGEALREAMPKRFTFEVKGHPDVVEPLQRVVSIHEARGEPFELELAMALQALGEHLWRLGRSAEAAPILERALRLQEEHLPAGSLTLGLSYAEMAVHRAEMGAFAESASLGERSEAILARQLAGDSPLRARQLFRIAWSAREAGAFARMERVLGTIEAEDASCFVGLHLRKNVLLADLMRRRGRLDEAKQLLLAEAERCSEQEQSFADLERVLSEKYEARERRGQPSGLDEYLHGRKRRAVRGLKATGTVFGNILLGLASLISGHSPGGFIGLPRPPTYEQIPALDPREAFFFETTGAVLHDSGLHGEAAAFFRGAVDSMTTGVGGKHPAVSRMQQALGEALWDAGTDRQTEKEALGVATESARLLDAYLHDALASLPEAQALRLVGTRDRPETLLFSGLLHGKETNWYVVCWEWVLRRRALVLDELAFRHQQAVSGESPEVVEAWEAWVASRHRLASLWVQGPDIADPDSYWSILAEAVRAREETEAALARVSASFRQSRGSGAAALSDVHRALPPDAALVEYVRVPVRDRGQAEAVPHYIGLILGGDRQADQFADLGPAEPIDGLVRDWHERLRASFGDAASGMPLEIDEVTEAGQKLRRAVWDPVVAQLDAAKLVFVVLEGSLHQVNLYALPREQGGYVIEEGPTIHLLSTGRDLIRLSGPDSVDAQGVIAFGDPDYDAGVESRLAGMTGDMGGGGYRGLLATCGGLKTRRWQALPESSREVEAIGSLFEASGPVEVLTGELASEERFKRDAPGKRILHVATHGFFLQAECLSSERGSRGLAGPPEGAQPASAGPIAENPLLLSGLVLAGANRVGPPEGEDGILTAEELAALDLRGTEVVALSACDTGLGTVAAGEGVFGLRRALEIAGTRTVLMSLWPVPDRSAREWMTSFYEQHAGGVPVAQATRDASVRALERTRAQGLPGHPYLWAGFVAAGGWQ